MRLDFHLGVGLVSVRDLLHIWRSTIGRYRSVSNFSFRQHATGLLIMMLGFAILRKPEIERSGSPRSSVHYASCKA